MHGSFAGGQRPDYALQQAKESLCKIMEGLSAMSSLPDLEGSTLWQLNWTEVSWPVEDIIVTKDGSRLWFKVTLRDISGSTKDAWMSENAALALARLDSKDEFLEAYKLQQPRFPAVASVKVLRRPQKTGDRSDATQFDGGSQFSDTSTGDARRINLTVVHAGDQPLNERPTQATLQLLPLMDALREDTSCILPASLDMVKTSHPYAFQVFYPGDEDTAKTGVPARRF